jgi:hypothetical protein
MELDTTAREKITTNCKDMSGWIKFLGIVYMISGGISIIFTFGIGIIIAWMPIWLGVILLKVSNGSRAVADGKAESLGEMFGSLKTFFILSGIFTIISIAFSLIWFMFIGIAMISGFLGEAGGLY